MTPALSLPPALSLTIALVLAACGEQKDAAPVGPVAGGVEGTVVEAVNERVDQDLVIIVRDVAQLPATGKERPLARINALVHAGDGSARVFAVDMDGVIHVIERDQLLPAPFLDVALVRGKAFVHDDTEKGLLSVAFHPDYARTGAPGFGKFYTASTELASSAVADFPTPDPQGGVSHHDVIAEWRVDAKDGNRADPSSRREVLRIADPLRDHTIGQIAFNPKARSSDADYAKLYIGIGDGGDTFPVRREIDAMRNAQNPRVPLGKILRITRPPPRGARHGAAATTRSWATRSTWGRSRPTACAIRSVFAGTRVETARCLSSTSVRRRRRRSTSPCRGAITAGASVREAPSSTIVTRARFPPCRRTTQRWDSPIRRWSTSTISAERSPAAACIAAACWCASAWQVCLRGHRERPHLLHRCRPAGERQGGQVRGDQAQVPRAPENAARDPGQRQPRGSSLRAGRSRRDLPC